MTGYGEAVLDRVGPQSHGWCPDKRQKGDTQTRRRRPGDHRGRGWRDVATSPGTPGPQGLEEAGRTLSCSLRRERGPAHTLILDGWLQSWERMNPRYFKTPPG